jgi:hypothetical protein
MISAMVTIFHGEIAVLYDYSLCFFAIFTPPVPSTPAASTTASGSLIHHSCQKTYPPPVRLTTVGLACRLVNNIRRKLVRSSSQNFDSRGAKHCRNCSLPQQSLHTAARQRRTWMYIPVECLHLFTAKFYAGVQERRGVGQFSSKLVTE